MKKRLLFVTGTRADFGKIEPLALAARDAGHEVSFFVTGMHMLDRYGLTKIEVHRTPGVTVHEFLNQRIGDPQDMVLAKTVLGFSDFIAEHRPDLVIVNRFGKDEAEGRGFRAVFEKACELDIPVLTVVREAYLPEWRAMTGSARNELPAEAAQLENWLAARLSRPAA